MAKHEWVRDQLDNWARWLDQGKQQSQGYPKVSTIARWMPSGSSTDSDHVPVHDLAARQVDAAVRSLRFSKPQLWLVLFLRHWGDPRRANGQQGGALGVADTARVMCVAESTVYAYYRQALERVAKHMDEASSN